MVKIERFKYLNLQDQYKMKSIDSIVELEKAWESWGKADRKAAGKSPRQKGGVMGRIKNAVVDCIEGTAIALLIAGAVAMPLRYAATVPIANLGNSSVAASSLSPAGTSLQMEIGDIYSFLTIAKQDAGDSLKTQGVDLSGTTYTSSELEQIAAQAAPFIAQELGYERVNIPNFVVRELGIGPNGLSVVAGGYSPWSLEKDSWWNTAVIANELSFPNVAALVAHETTHAQSIAGPAYKFLIGYLFGRTSLFPGVVNETFAELITLEALANQALQGNPIARYAVLDRLTYGLEAEMKRQSGGKLTNIDILHFQRPASTVLQALAGKQESYHGIRLDGITRLVNQEIRVFQPVN